MHPFLLLLLAIVSPFLLAATLLLPVYAGILAAAYIIYAKGTIIHPLTGKLLDVFYIIDVYTNLFSNWVSNITASSFITYSAPVTAFPIFGAILAFWLTRKLARGLKNLFQLGASV